VLRLPWHAITLHADLLHVLRSLVLGLGWRHFVGH
jgi:hypothetical protein